MDSGTDMIAAAVLALARLRAVRDYFNIEDALRPLLMVQQVLLMPSFCSTLAPLFAT